MTQQRQDDAAPRDASVPSQDNLQAMTAARLASTLQSAGDGIIVTDSLGRVEFLNRVAEHLVGLDSATARGRGLHEVLCLEESDGHPVKGDLVELAIVSEEPVTLGKDLVLRPHTGKPRQVEGEICVCSGGASPGGAVVTFRDVTARNQDELRRREEQKMRAIGQLAGSVAHELNGLLTEIVGQSEAMEDACAEQPRLKARLGEIRRAAGKIGTITRQLLSLSGRAVLFPETVNLNALLGGIREKLDGVLPPGIKLTMSLEPHLGAVAVDAKQTEQALMDLIGYCRDRMPAGGRLQVATANLILDENNRAQYCRRYAKLTVKDEGPSLRGVPAEKLFEPAWALGHSKPSGLGLFAVRSVVNAVKGHFSVESEGETGVVFVMLIPQLEEEEAPAVPTPAAVKQSGYRPTILLVEDDDGIRVLLHNSLEKRGYRVIEARDGVEGVLQAELCEDPIDLLITDVVMPVMDGPALALALTKTRPNLKLLLISGCPEDLVGTQQLINRGAHFAQKPFSQRELLARVDLILSADDIAVMNP
ncbi:MAG: response regulator [Acidobacteria bacterium]|nr:response regulator [Acidobacteriota bacterium]